MPGSSYLRRIARPRESVDQLPRLKPAHALLHRWESARLTGTNIAELSSRAPTHLDAPGISADAEVPGEVSSESPSRITTAQGRASASARNSASLPGRDEAPAANSAASFSGGKPMRAGVVRTDRGHRDKATHGNASTTSSYAVAAAKESPRVALSTAAGKIAQTTAGAPITQNDVPAHAPRLRASSGSIPASDSRRTSRPEPAKPERTILLPRISTPLEPLSEREDKSASLRIGLIEVTVVQPPPATSVSKAATSAVAHGLASSPLSRSFVTSLGLRQS